MSCSETAGTVMARWFSSDELPFLRALYQQPEEEAPRLIYADYLEDRGDLRAEYLRALVQQHHEPKRGKRKYRAAMQQKLAELAAQIDAAWTQRLPDLRPPAGTRFDLVQTTVGQSRIEVRTGAGDVVLLVQGQPIALTWRDDEKSVGLYLAYINDCPKEDVSALESLVAGDVDPHRSLAEQVRPLLSVFTPGVYYLSLIPSTENQDPELAQHWPNTGSHGRYPYRRHRICTQPYASLNAQRVDDYVERIQGGQRPIVLTTTAEGAQREFVIDGHHKLAAYEHFNWQPAILSIVRWDAAPITIEEGVRYLPAEHPLAERYFDRKHDWEWRNRQRKDASD